MVQQNEEKTTETLKEERYIWMARSFSLVAFLALLANIFMIVALSGLTPLVRVQPFYLITQSKEQQVVSVERFSSLKTKDLQQSLIREYILARYGISSDKSEVENRWGVSGLVFAMSTDPVYQDFTLNESEALLKRMDEEGLTRNVKIKSVVPSRPRSDGRYIWKVEMDTIDMSQKAGDKFTQSWTVSLAVDFLPTQSMNWDKRLTNPLGFVVTSFGRVPSEDRAKILRGYDFGD